MLYIEKMIMRPTIKKGNRTCLFCGKKIANGEVRWSIFSDAGRVHEKASFCSDGHLIRHVVKAMVQCDMMKDYQQWAQDLYSISGYNSYPEENGIEDELKERTHNEGMD